MTLTAKQIRSARVLLGWTQVRLALEGEISFLRIKKFELGKGRLSILEISTIRRLFESAGVIFTNGGEPSVKLRS
jgi:hypothetical protein